MFRNLGEHQIMHGKTEYSQGTIYCDKVLRHLMPQENGNNGHALNVLAGVSLIDLFSLYVLVSHF